MANQFQWVDWLSMESLRVLKNKLVIARKFNSDYNKEFTREFAVGETVRVKYPQRFLVTDGLTYQPQPLVRKFTTVTVDQIPNIHFEWDSVEKALNMERGEDIVRKEYIEPAMSQLAQEIDSRAALFAYQNSNLIAGVLGTDPTDSTIGGTARQKLIENACPPGDKIVAISPSAMTKIVNGSTTIFNPGDEISRQYKEGYVGRARGFDWFESMSIYSHTAGNWQGAVTVNGANQSGSSLTVTMTAGDVVKQGDVFSIANTNNVNPKTRRSVNAAKTFVIQNAFTAAGGGVDVLQISPPIVGPGDQYQNVDALPANSAALTLFPGTASPNQKVGTNGLALHEDAFALVGVKLELPKAVEMSSQTRDPETGLAIRFVRAWDQRASKMTNRMDMLFGFGVLYNDQSSVRLLSA